MTDCQLYLQDEEFRRERERCEEVLDQQLPGILSDINNILYNEVMLDLTLVHLITFSKYITT